MPRKIIGFDYSSSRVADRVRDNEPFVATAYSDGSVEYILLPIQSTAEKAELVAKEVYDRMVSDFEKNTKK